MKEVSKLIREIVPVIIGVLIALLINNWNEDRKNEKYVSQIFSSIQLELEESNASIKEKMPKQQALLDSVSMYLNDETVSLIDIVRKVGGIEFVSIKNSSWKAISNSKIELVDHEKISTLSYIDEEKEGLEIRAMKVFDFMINNSNETSRNKKNIFMIILQDIIWAEKGLQSHIEELIKSQ